MLPPPVVWAAATPNARNKTDDARKYLRIVLLCFLIAKSALRCGMRRWPDRDGPPELVWLMCSAVSNIFLPGLHLRLTMWACFLLLFLPSALLAQSEHNELPAQLLSARTACLEMVKGYDRVLDETKKELKKWGRFKVVEDCPKADVIVWSSSRNSAREHYCRATVQVLGASDRAVLWSRSRSCDIVSNPTTYETVVRLIRDLEKDIKDNQH